MSVWPLHQRAIYWHPNGNDAFGNQTFAAPIVIAVRFEIKNELIINELGEEEQSMAMVCLDDLKDGTDYEVLCEGFIYLLQAGENSATIITNNPSPIGLANAWKVRQKAITVDAKASPNIRRPKRMVRVWL